MMALVGNLCQQKPKPTPLPITQNHVIIFHELDKMTTQRTCRAIKDLRVSGISIKSKLYCGRNTRFYCKNIMQHKISQSTFKCII